MKQLVVIDDEKEMEDFYHILLEDFISQKKLEFNFFYQSKEFLIWINEENPQIDLILCDINMPVINGIELITYLRNKNYNTNVFFLSGYDEMDFEKEIKSLKIQKFISKPIDLDQLSSEISKVLFE